MSEAKEAPLTVAVPKGRVLGSVCARLEDAGLDAGDLRADDRRLVREDRDAALRYLLLKPDDVVTYVEYGAADLGIVGRDVLLERGSDLFAPLDLGIGRCRLSVAGLPGTRVRARSHLRVGTKFPNLARQHFAARGRPVEVIVLQGSVELAPLTGLADLIVDLVETGETLRRNGLVELETIQEISTVVVANRVGLKLRHRRVRPLLTALGGEVQDQG
ncbi:MAG: ATP phosphoribosyltransferase [Sandaracinaceae bacterium]